MAVLDALVKKTNDFKKNIEEINRRENAPITGYSQANFQDPNLYAKNVLQATWNIAHVFSQIAEMGQIADEEVGNIMGYSRQKPTMVPTLEKHKLLQALISNLDFLKFKVWIPHVSDESTADIGLAYLDYLTFLKHDSAAIKLLTYHYAGVEVLGTTRDTLFVAAPPLIKKSLKTYFKNTNKKLNDVIPRFPANIKEELHKFFADLDDVNWDSMKQKAREELEQTKNTSVTITEEEKKSIEDQYKVKLSTLNNNVDDRKTFINEAIPFLKIVEEALSTSNAQPFLDFIQTLPQNEYPTAQLHKYLNLNKGDTQAAEIINKIIVSGHNRRVNHTVDVPRLVRGIQGSRSGIGSLDPADKPRDVGKSSLPGDCDRIQIISFQPKDEIIHKQDQIGQETAPPQSSLYWLMGSLGSAFNAALQTDIGKALTGTVNLKSTIAAYEKELKTKIEDKPTLLSGSTGMYGLQRDHSRVLETIKDEENTLLELKQLHHKLAQYDAENKLHGIELAETMEKINNQLTNSTSIHDHVKNKLSTPSKIAHEQYNLLDEVIDLLRQNNDDNIYNLNSL
ncbi:hypothetical protein N9Q05_02505, partial [bacterium]|nr:hypothetical protein [bacterium]